MPTELELQREVTLAFIAADSIVISLVPHARVRQPSGGFKLMPPVFPAGPRAGQTMRLIPMSHTTRPATSSSASAGVDGGQQRRHEFTLLAAWDAFMAVGDQWEDVNGVLWVIDEILPPNNYEKKALITRYTGGA